MMDDTACIVVPCFNEALRIKQDEFLDFSAHHHNIDFVFVDDGSTDNTAEILSAMCSKQENLSALTLARNSGKALAVKQGVLSAVSGSYDFIGYWDADLSTPLDEIPRLIQQFNKPEIEIVIGSRIKILGNEIDRKLVRHLAGRIFATAASMTLKLPVYDTQCGAKLFKNNDNLQRAFSANWLSNWAFDVELLRRFQLLHNASEQTGYIKEIPLKHWHDTAGSKVKAFDLFISLYDLLHIAFHYNKQSTIEEYS